MNVQTTNMDAISNNLANLNTNGYKSTRAEFQDLLYQTINVAGTNTSSTTTQPGSLQLGAGSKLSAMVKDFSTGTTQSTDSPYNMAIQGEGFFQVLMTDGTYAYTRDGSFTTDQNGNLVTSSGLSLYPQITVPQDATSVTIATQRPHLPRAEPPAADPGQRRPHPGRPRPDRAGHHPAERP
jgi:flagellar basal-body rod protein FlgG